MFICPFVCLSARLSRKPRGRTSPNFSARCLLILLWWRCDMLYTSGFVDDDKFLHNGPYGPSCLHLSGKRLIAKTTALISTKFCSTIKKISVHVVGCASGAKFAIYRCLVFMQSISGTLDSLAIKLVYCRPTCMFAALKYLLETVIVN